MESVPLKVFIRLDPSKLPRSALSALPSHSAWQHYPDSPAVHGSFTQVPLAQTSLSSRLAASLQTLSCSHLWNLKDPFNSHCLQEIVRAFIPHTMTPFSCSHLTPGHSNFDSSRFLRESSPILFPNPLHTSQFYPIFNYHEPEFLPFQPWSHSAALAGPCCVDQDQVDPESTAVCPLLVPPGCC